MADIIELHPFVREHREPRLSAAALAEYLILRPDQQDTVLHNSRFATPPQVVPHSEAMRALRSYNADPRRDQGRLEAVKRVLTLKAENTTLKPKAREEARRCIETIQLFERGENAFGLRSWPLSEPGRFAEVYIEKVAVSIQPDLLIEPTPRPGEERRVGGVILRPQKAPDPTTCKTDETRVRKGEQRREIDRYLVSLIYILLETHPELGRADRDLCFVSDLRLGERINFPSDHLARVRAVHAACRHIAQLWDGIQPRKSVLKKPLNENQA
jgi:hypothetical protein